MRLAIEMGSNGSKYAVIHREDCRDLQDGMPLGEADNRTDAAALAENELFWDYDPYDWSFAPCTNIR